MENITGIGSIKTIVAQISISAEELQELINSSELRLALSHAPALLLALKTKAIAVMQFCYAFQGFIIMKESDEEDNRNAKMDLFRNWQQTAQNEKSPPQIAEDTEEKGIIEITQEDLKKMPKNITKGKILAGGFSVGWRKLQSGKNSYTYNVRFKREGYNIDFCDQHKENLKPRFLEELKNQSSQKQKESKSGVPITFHPFALYYFNNFRVKKVVPETFEKDLSRYNNHLAPYFKETLIKSITPTHCQNLLERLTEQEKWKTASELYSLMNGIFDCAIDHHIIQFSPMDTVQAIEYEKESGSALLIEEEGHLLLAVKDTPYEICFAIILYTGLRPNEYITVRLDENKLFIIAKKSKQKKKKNGEEVFMKIPVTPMLRPYIEKYPDFKMLTAKYLRKIFKKILPNHMLYDLRTTFYTRCKECHIGEAARKEYMGHSLGALGNAYTDLSDEYLLREGEKFKY